MHQHEANEINRLIGEFMNLLECWESDPAAFDWAPLQALACSGAHAYNEGAGPSFHALVLDKVEHGAFHERFFAYSLESGFDPFKLVHAGSGTAVIPAIDHASLAQDAQSNPASARMRAALMELARTRFASSEQELGHAGAPSDWVLRTIEACAESIPLDMLERLQPELVPRHAVGMTRQSVDPVEAYLTSAEMIVDRHSKNYG